MQINIVPQNLAKVAVLIAETRDEMLNDDGLFLQFGAYLDRWVQTNFRSSGASVGGWEPFKYGGRLVAKAKANAKSIDGRRWINGSARLELHTGALRASFYPVYFKGWPDRASSVVMGSDLPYAAYQHLGTAVLPARRLLPLEDEIIGDLMDMTNAWVAQHNSKLNGGG